MTPKKIKNKINRIFKCRICKKIFTLLRNLYRHMRECHLKQNFKKCEFCHRKYPRIKEHILRCKKNNKLKLVDEFMNLDIKTFEFFQNNILPQQYGLDPFKNDNNKDWIRIFKTNKDLTGKFEISNKILGNGSYGAVYFGFNLVLGIPIAIKCMREEKENLERFYNEVNFLNELKDEEFFPKIYYSEFNKRNKIIIQSLFGPNLEELLYLCGGKLPLYTVINITIELIKRIKIMHNHGILHRDITPSNIVFGNFSFVNDIEKYEIYIIDYGLSIKFLDDKNIHYEYSKNYKFVGTLDYASTHAHSRENQSRRDDMESLFYVILFLLHGELPWKKNGQIRQGNKFELLEEIGIIKNNIKDYNLFKELPKIFKFIYKNIKVLEFKEEPPYDFFITLLEKEKELIHKSNNNKAPKYKYFWLNIINDALFSKNKKKLKALNIKKIFHNIKIESLLEFFEDINNK